MNDQEFERLKATLLALTGLDLDSYKSQQVRRRLDGFVAGQAPSAAEYCEKLRRDRAALELLQQFVTINVSEFFRDKEQFHTLKTSVLPDLLKRSPSLKVWSAGCSHGEEPYSLAILLAELSPNRNHKITATDMNEKVIATAKQGGPYEASQVRNVDPVHLMKYFTKAEDGYRVNSPIRNMVRFTQHNLLGEPVETGVDLIVCRNVVIYFTDDAKTRLVRAFWRSLKEGGVLFMGACEGLTPIPGVEFSRVGNSIYQKPVRDRATLA